MVTDLGGKLIRHYLDLNPQFTANISPTLYLCDSQLNYMVIRTVGIRTNSNILKSAMICYPSRRAVNKTLGVVETLRVVIFKRLI